MEGQQKNRTCTGSSMGCGSVSKPESEQPAGRVDVQAALRKTPFFVAASNATEGHKVAGASLLEDIAGKCMVLSMKAEMTFNELPQGLDGAFVIVHSGELVHTSGVGRHRAKRPHEKEVCVAHAGRGASGSC